MFQNVKIHYLILVLVFLNVNANNNKNDATSEYQNALNNLISRLGTYNNSSDNLVFMPPTFSVDIVSLLRWAVENTREQPTLRSRGSPSLNKENTVTDTINQHFYNKNLLDLIQFNGKNYFFCKNQKMPWVDAMQFCRAYNMDLVSVETVQEDDFLIQQINKFGLTKSVFWMSGNKIGRSTLMWLHGETMIYENWNTGEPSHPAIEHCMMYHQSKWYDVSCQDPSNFICEER